MSSQTDHHGPLIHPNNVLIYRWLGLWLEFIGNLIVLFAGIFAVVEKDNINPGLAGLSVSYALQVQTPNIV